MALFVVLKPDSLLPYGFSVKRTQLPEDRAVYHQYYYLNRDTFADNLTPKQECLMMLYRPLFLTSFLLEDYLTVTNKTPQIVIASASSKTGYSLAYLLKIRNRPVKVIGLTSAKNQKFVQGLKLYDSVIPYTSITSIPQAESTYIDFSGDRKILHQVYEHLGKQNFKQSIAVGLSHWDSNVSASFSDSIKSEVFFAPLWLKKRSAEIGGPAFTESMKTSLGQCIIESDRWTQVIEGSGIDTVKRTYEKVLKGDYLPEDGFVLSFEDKRSKI